MKIFEHTGGWNDKTNFVDQNNVLLGYDMHQDCCEDANWFIADKIVTDYEEKREYSDGFEGFEDLTDWVFDPNFCEEQDVDWVDAGGLVVFRIVNGNKEQFIHLFNCHNGYYSHGFHLDVGGKTITSGSL